MDNVIVVVPTIREGSIRAFLDAWQFTCPVIVVEDNPERSFDLPGAALHYAWSDIDRDLGRDGWIIPRRTDCVRSYGYWMAWRAGAQYIVTLDDDCLPHEGQSAGAFLTHHVANLQPQPQARWHSTIKGHKPRGYPYEARDTLAPVALSHGVWNNVPDYDALTQLHLGRVGGLAGDVWAVDGLVPRGSYFPMCGMNLAWRAEYTPLLYFGLQGQNAQGEPWPFDRFGDIWAGVMAKRVLDHLGVAAYSGGPMVHHARASNVWANLRKEAPGLPVNEEFWQWVDAVRLVGDDPVGCYYQIAQSLRERGDYWAKLGRAMAVWGGLYA